MFFVLLQKRKKLIWPIFLFCIIYIVTNTEIFANLARFVSIFDSTQPHYSIKNRSNADYLKKILFYNDYFSHTEASFNGGQELFNREKCPIRSCYITTNRQEFAPEDLSAVIWHGNGRDKSFPTKRYSHIWYIFFLLEPPVNADAVPEELKGVFNYTMSYRRDADIYTPYDSFVQITDQNSDHNFHAINYAENKSKMALWFASRCFSWSGRERWYNFLDTLVEALQSYLKVDVYGFCGPHKCQDRNCFKKLAKEYKFYLAFENSLCEDYVTEKFFKSAWSNIVPVVYGSADYDTFSPPKSYINAMNFKNPKLLADYLLYLDKNDSAYNEFFEWKNHYKLIGVHKARLCTLCAKLHTNSKKKEYRNLSDWYNEGKCFGAENPLVQEGKGFLSRCIKIIYYFVYKLFLL